MVFKESAREFPGDKSEFCFMSLGSHWPPSKSISLFSYKVLLLPVLKSEIVKGLSGKLMKVLRASTKMTGSKKIAKFVLTRSNHKGCLYGRRLWSSLDRPSNAAILFRGRAFRALPLFLVCLVIGLTACQKKSVDLQINSDERALQNRKPVPRESLESPSRPDINGSPSTPLGEDVLCLNHNDVAVGNSLTSPLQGLSVYQVPLPQGVTPAPNTGAPPSVGSFPNAVSNWKAVHWIGYDLGKFNILLSRPFLSSPLQKELFDELFEGEFDRSDYEVKTQSYLRIFSGPQDLKGKVEELHQIIRIPAPQNYALFHDSSTGETIPLYRSSSSGSWHLGNKKLDLQEPKEAFPTIDETGNWILVHRWTEMKKVRIGVWDVHSKEFRLFKLPEALKDKDLDSFYPRLDPKTRWVFWWNRIPSEKKWVLLGQAIEERGEAKIIYETQNIPSNFVFTSGVLNSPVAGGSLNSKTPASINTFTNADSVSIAFFEGTLFRWLRLETQGASEVKSYEVDLNLLFPQWSSLFSVTADLVFSHDTQTFYVSRGGWGGFLSFQPYLNQWREHASYLTSFRCEGLSVNPGRGYSLWKIPLISPSQAFHATSQASQATIKAYEPLEPFETSQGASK